MRRKANIAIAELFPLEKCIYSLKVNALVPIPTCLLVRTADVEANAG